MSVSDKVQVSCPQWSPDCGLVLYFTSFCRKDLFYRIFRLVKRVFERRLGVGSQMSASGAFDLKETLRQQARLSLKKISFFNLDPTTMDLN